MSGMLTSNAAAAMVLGGSVVLILGIVGLAPARCRAWLARWLGGDALAIAAVAVSKVGAGLAFAVASVIALRMAMPERAAIGWSVELTGRAVALWLVAAVVCLTSVALASRQPAMRERYPEARAARFDAGARLADAVGWLVYLYGYELLLRGVLLFPLVALVPLGAALALHSALYALAHLDKPLAEILGTVPMGFVFGWLAIETGSILPGFALHAAIAITNSTLCSRAARNPRSIPIH